MRIVPSIAFATLLILGACPGCHHQQQPFSSGDHNPVNADAMPTPEISGTAPETSGTAGATLMTTPGTPPPDLVPSPVPAAAMPSPGA